MMSPAAAFRPEIVANVLLWLSMVLTILGVITLVARRRHGEVTPAQVIDHLPASLGIVLLLAHVVMRANLLGRFPVGNLRESSAFLALLLGIAYLVAVARFRYPAVEALLLVVVIIFLALAIVVPVDPAGATRDNLGSRWFVFHTTLTFLGVAALFAACVVSILYLLADGQLKSKRPGVLLRFLPSLVACDRTAEKLLLFGFPLLSLGMIAGWLWSRETAGFQVGPKEMWAVTAWAIYGALVGVRVTGRWTGRKAAILSVTGAVAAMVAFLGIRM